MDGWRACLGALAGALALVVQASPPLTVIVYVPPTPGIVDADASGRVKDGEGFRVLQNMAEGADLAFEVFTASVPRATREVSGRANICMSGVVRTSDRENLFQWVGPLARTELQIFALAARPPNLGLPADLRGWRVGTLRGSLPAQWLREQGVEPMEVSHQLTGMRMLEAGRFDLWAASNLATLAIEGGATRTVVPVYTISSIDLYMACGLSTAQALMARLDASAARMRRQGLLRPYGLQ